MGDASTGGGGGGPGPTRVLVTVEAPLTRAPAGSTAYTLSSREKPTAPNAMPEGAPVMPTAIRATAVNCNVCARGWNVGGAAAAVIGTGATITRRPFIS